jgi:hypothetical protein
MELIELYQQASDITKPLCLKGEGCKELADKPYHCCHKKYCDMAAKFALDGYGIVLQPTGHEIPFMSSIGCIVPSHLRPVCTLHVCSISWAGKSNIQNDTEKTRAFLELRENILRLEAKEGREVYSNGN